MPSPLQQRWAKRGRTSPSLGPAGRRTPEQMPRLLKPQRWREGIQA